MVKCNVSAVVENDHSVFSGNRLPPPLVIDAPLLAHGFHSASRFAGQAHVGRFAVFVGVNCHNPRSTERSQAGCVAHGSKLSNA